MIIDDEIRIIVKEIELNSDNSSDNIFKLIRQLHKNCKTVKQRYENYKTKFFTIGKYPLDSDGYAISYDPLTQEKELWDSWNKYGITVSKNVISKDLLNVSIKRIDDILYELSDGKFILSDPTTFKNGPKDSSGNYFLSRGFMEVYHDDFLAQIRQSLKVYLHYVIIWGCVNLWTSFDRVGVKMPGSNGVGLPLHVDQNPVTNPEHYSSVQGILPFVDCKECGTFVAVPGSQTLFNNYKNSAENINHRGEYVELDLSKDFSKELVSGKQIIPVRKNCLLSWSSSITHANSSNISKNVRKLAYISMMPSKNYSQMLVSLRKSAYESGTSKYNHDAGLRVTKRPRYIGVNNFRIKEKFSNLGSLLYSFNSYENVLFESKSKKLLMNAEIFGYGPSAAISMFLPKLKKHFDHVAFIGSKFSLEIQSESFDAVYDLKDMEKIIDTYDVFFTALDFKMAEISVKHNVPTIIYDSLTWYWKTIPKIVKSNKVLYIAQNFLGVSERINNESDMFNLTCIVNPIIEPIDLYSKGHKDIVLLNLGGIKNPYWSNDTIIKYTKEILRNLPKNLPKNLNIVIIGNSLISNHFVEITTKSYKEVLLLLPRVKLSIVTPGLGNIYDNANYHIPTIFLPPVNDSQELQASLMEKHDFVEHNISWEDIGIKIDFTKTQKNIMEQIKNAIDILSINIEFQENFKNKLLESCEKSKNLTTSKCSKLLTLFGNSGTNQVIKATRTFSLHF